MPPPSLRDSDNTFVDESGPYYTNEDVAILHDIVVHAEELLPTLPERDRLPTNALFQAYGEVIASVGIDPVHDNRYAHLLFRVGGIRGNSSLYEKFAAVLSRMGIEIQFDQETRIQAKDSSKELEPQDQAVDIPLKVIQNQVPEYQHRGRHRRNSEGSLWDIARGAGGSSKLRRFQAPGSNPNLENLDGQQGRLQDPQSNIQVINQNPTQHENYWYGQGRGIGAWLNGNVPGYSPQSRTRSVSPYERIRFGRNILQDQPVIVSDSTLSSSSYSAHHSYANFVPKASEGSDQGNHQNVWDSSGTSQTLREIRSAHAERLNSQRLVRSYLRIWHQKGLQSMEDKKNLEFIARHRDTQVLLRQAFETWRVTTLEQQQRAETENFFRHLERRATKMRDLFLLSKAFFNWAQEATEETQRAAVARRHIMRTRYFQAWREITAVNDLKVRRHIIRKFFRTWQITHKGKKAQERQALMSYEKNVVLRIYRTWFTKFCASRASAMWANRLKHKYLVKWTIFSEKAREDEHTAQHHSLQQLLLKTCCLWSTKMRMITRQIQLANKCDRGTLCQKQLRQWRHASGLLTSVRRIQAGVELRLTQSSFDLWILRARQEREATHFDYLKIKREAWAAWNDRLRSRTLELRIDDRLVLRGLYKWVLAERLILARRLLDHRVARYSLQSMVQASHIYMEKLTWNTHVAQVFDAHILQKEVIRQWRSRLNGLIQNNKDATCYGAPNILSNTLSKWTKSLQQIRVMSPWANNANFYLLAGRTLRRWKDSTESSQREKRRRAYAQIRRKIKIKLASQLMSRWREYARLISQAQAQAADVRSNKSVILGMEIYDRWRGRAEEIMEMKVIPLQTVLRKRLNIMKVRLGDLQHFETVATGFSEERLLSVEIKKWTRAALQLRAQQHLMFELREKYRRKALRKMIAHWHQTVLERRQTIDIDAYPTATSSQDIPRATDRATDWAGFEEDLDIDKWTQELDDANMTQIPRYLSTPSKRFARRTITRPSTTPMAPLSTPSERHLRAQYSGQAVPSWTPQGKKLRGFPDLRRQLQLE